MPNVAIVGRANVGKSTLFNRLAGKHLAIVHDTPGVTRDRREAEIRTPGGLLRLVDTAGFDADASKDLSARIARQTGAAIREADACIFLIDARDGVTAADTAVAAMLRKGGKPVVLAANKCEGRVKIADAEAFALGYGAPIAISAEHNLGVDNLVDALAPFVAPGAKKDEIRRPLHVAIVGRQNVGKSSLFNQLLCEERALTGPEAGLTRDAISVPWNVNGRRALLYDTAGMRKRARIAGETLEQLAVESALDAIRFADCVVVLMDAQVAFEKQDLVIADLIEQEGRAIVFAMNKWDLIENRAGAIGKLAKVRDRLLPQSAGAPVIAVSARTGEGIDRLAGAILKADRAWNTRIATPKLNRFLKSATERHAVPAREGKGAHIRYMTQAKIRPPTFALFGTRLSGVSDPYLRYLKNSLRETFGLAGTPIRFLLRQAKNPYTRN